MNNTRWSIKVEAQNQSLFSAPNAMSPPVVDDTGVFIVLDEGVNIFWPMSQVMYVEWYQTEVAA